MAIKGNLIVSASYIVGLAVKIFLLLTPFFVLSVFVSTCGEMDSSARKNLALRTGLAVVVAAAVFYLLGEAIFACLGISLNAFRIGAGLVLMLNGIDMVRSSLPKNRQVDNGGDAAIVPLAIPTTVGPGTIGTLLVLGANGAERAAEVGVSPLLFKSVEVSVIVLAGCGVGVILYFSESVNRLLKENGVKILSKLTGMYIVALAAQIIFDGVSGFLK